MQLAFGLLLTWTAAAVAQQLSITPETFAAADATEKNGVLAQIIRHELPAGGETVAALITTGFGDTDTNIRKMALAAVVSRAAGPRFVSDTAVLNDWIVDRDGLQTLRPQIIRLLQGDPDEDVRVAAISALVSLDFSIVALDLQIGPLSQQLLVERFYLDSSAKVRAKIVAGFGTDRRIDSTTVRKLLTGAFGDPDHRVRHSAISGAERLDRNTAISLLVRQLRDQNRGVRLQAASVLAKFGNAASAHLSEIEDVLRHEGDMQIRKLLQKVVAGAKHE